MRTKARRERLLAILTESGETGVRELVRLLEASEATVRRDLTALQAGGRVIRTPGGARLQAEKSLVIRTFQEKQVAMRAAKEQIARRAAEQVSPGMVVALDSGTTVWRLAAALIPKSPLTVLTNALAVIEALGAVPGIEIYCGGGKLNPRNLDFVGPGSLLAGAGLRADVAFLGADSVIPSRGIYTMDEASAQSSAALARCAARRVVLADHTKFHARGCHRILEASEIQGIVTDAALPRDVLDELKAAPFDLVLAP